jgi:hypothetical protein
MKRCRRIVLTALLASVLGTFVGALTPARVGASTPALPAPPHTPKLTAAIETFAPYQPQFFCRHTVEPGVKAFEHLLLTTYPKTRSDGDMRSCSVAGTSEHKDGRAFDWGADHRIPAQRRAGESLLKWLFATDAYGNADAMVRRLGLMYIIWNKRIWGVWDQRWEPYSCSGPTLCHVNHMHFSFDWAGAEKKTSYWTHSVTGAVEPPLPRLKLDTRRTLEVGATAGEVTAHWLLVGGGKYAVTASGVWHRAGKAADPVCTKTASGWQPSSRQLDVGGDQLHLWGAQWKPTRNTGNGCNPATHAYRMILTPGLLSTFTAELPGSGHDSGAVTVKVARTA